MDRTAGLRLTLSWEPLRTITRQRYLFPSSEGLSTAGEPGAQTRGRNAYAGRVLPLALLAASLCGPAVAKAQVLSQPALRPLVDTVRYGGGVDTLICHDFTGDGRVDMAFTIFSGGTAGDTAWVVLRRTSTGWRVAYRQLSAYKVALTRAGSDLVETQPVYRKNDPNCCPSGGFDHRRLRWNGRTFAAVRSWHDRSLGP